MHLPAKVARARPTSILPLVVPGARANNARCSYTLLPVSGCRKVRRISENAPNTSASPNRRIPVSPEFPNAEIVASTFKICESSVVPRLRFGFHEFSRVRIFARDPLEHFFGSLIRWV